MFVWFPALLGDQSPGGRAMLHAAPMQIGTHLFGSLFWLGGRLDQVYHCSDMSSSHYPVGIAYVPQMPSALDDDLRLFPNYPCGRWVHLRPGL